ncbi:MAG TPA: aspartate-semialdehyde dehydrogenase [Gemmatimonadales bacterium]|nr:aspartate-semialdehyde dehydrogenase [Gemmatimonadales bacterium]
MSAKIPVAVLGATGTVGQKFVRLLADHPWFEIAAVAASASSAGRRYAEATRWREPLALPAHVGDMIVRECAAPLPARIVFSALDAEVAGPIEQAFAQAGAYVVTNTRTHRMEADVPLLIPEANADHLSLIDRQHQERGWKGAILANPNCSTAALAMALAPLHRAFEVQRLFVSTMQAVSGAGYPGVASLDIVGNVIPHIGGEEEKIERESRKVLGTLSDGLVQAAEFAVSAHTNRVPVVDGHMMTVSIGFSRRVSPEEAAAALRRFRAPPCVAGLPSSPALPIEVDDRPDRPQPRLDLDRGHGMAVTVGRIRACPVLDIRMVVLGHNTIRGAAGQAVQIAELLVAEGRVPRGPGSEPES